MRVRSGGWEAILFGYCLGKRVNVLLVLIKAFLASSKEALVRERPYILESIPKGVWLSYCAVGKLYKVVGRISRKRKSEMCCNGLK